MWRRATKVPGKNSSQEPDECGFRACRFVELVRDNQMVLAWNMMSNETHGIWEGVWATRNNIQLAKLYKDFEIFGQQAFRPMLDHIHIDLLNTWGRDNLNMLGVGPTRYLDDQRAIVRFVIGIIEEKVFDKPTSIPGIIIPMKYEDNQWKVHFPGYGWFLE